MKDIDAEAQSSSGAGGSTGGRLHGVPGKALACFAGAAVLMLAYGGWSLHAGRTPPAVLPPAGQVIETAAPLRFVVLGDSRGNMSVFESVLAKAWAERPAVVLHSGDIVERCAPRQFEWVLRELHEDGMPVPLCVVPGNHDIDDSPQGAEGRNLLYERAFGPRHYWFAVGHTLFVALDTAAETVSADELRWLDSVLADNRAGYKACFVFTHVPPAMPGVWHSLKDGTEALMSVLRKHSVTALFCGHVHSYLERSVEGMPVYVSGGAGADLESSSDSYHYLLCTLAEDGSLRVEKKDVDALADEEYPEYLLHVKLQTWIIVAAAALAVGGIVLTGRPRRAEVPATR